jgi:hypothetical protein
MDVKQVVHLVQKRLEFTEEVLRRSESFSLLDWWQETHAEAA